MARRRSLITDFGKIADPIADKALTSSALITLSYLGEIPWWITAVIVVRELAVTGLRFWVIRWGVIAASRGGKLKTLLQVIAICLYVLPAGLSPPGILRGLVMGLSRAQIAEQMSEIREFSGLGDYLDLPIRTYSSGMLLRLAFAVATSVQRDIVLMDELLAVGDAEFAQRAEDRLHDRLARTSILVLATHSDELVRKVCNRRIELRQGRVVSDEPVGQSA